MSNMIYCGNALSILQQLPSESVQMCVTSPPYYGLRDYGVNGQIGVESTPSEYTEALVAVFQEVRRVLKPDGTLWLNIGDSYAGSGKGAWNRPIEKRPSSKQIYHCKSDDRNATMPKRWKNIKAKDLLGIPWLLAFSLRDDGWYLRSDVIWQKPNCLPEAVKDRPTKSYEHLFLLAKQPNYYYDRTAIMEPISKNTLSRNKHAAAENKYTSGIPEQSIQTTFRPQSSTESSGMRNKRDVWNISTNGYRANGHYAVFPEKLVEPCILAGCPAGGVVLDPFFGSGTVGAVCKRLGRQYIGIELNHEYCALAQARIDKVKEETAIGSQN